MSLEAARAMLATPRGTSSWDYIIAGSESCFIWDAHGDEFEQWNRLAGPGAGLPAVESRVENGFTQFFSYRGHTVQVPHVEGPDDNAISIHTLSQLVKADSELRWCVDSRGNSNHAYLALPPADWLLLEQQFGKRIVDSRFAPLPADLEGFWDVHDRGYETITPAKPNPVKLWLGRFVRRYWIYLILLSLIVVAILASPRAPR